MTKATVVTLPAAAEKSAPPSQATARRMRISMGTLVAIEAAGHSSSAVEVAVESAFTAVTEVDRLMHPHCGNSDLARINNAAPYTPIAVHSSICELLKLAHRLNELTNGVFDPCLPQRTGRLRDLEIVHFTDAAAIAGEAPAGYCFVICHAPVALDFGGFAKGYAVDRAIAVLQARGCTSGLVNAGGDLRVFGPRREPILLRRPNGTFDTVELGDAALAASDANSQRRPAEHQGYYIRANTAAAASIASYAAVIAKDAVIADAMVKCVLLCSKSTADRALREVGAVRAGHG